MVNNSPPERPLTLDQAKAAWLPRIERYKNCEDCQINVIEAVDPTPGIWKASPQRPDATLGYNDQQVLVYCMGCQRFPLYNNCRLFMEHGLDYQENVRDAIRSAEHPLPTLPFTASTIFPIPHREGYRIPHSEAFVINGIVVPPKDVADEIEAIWYRNMVTPNTGKKQVEYPPQVQPLFRLWWVSGDLSNLSGAEGSWVPNNYNKLCFDRILPGSKGGNYLIENILIILDAENSAKWDYPNEEATSWMAQYKHPVPVPPQPYVWTVIQVAESILRKRGRGGEFDDDDEEDED
jgi:hypothetical protein